jgi:hypothetical protein
MPVHSGHFNNQSIKGNKRMDDVDRVGERQEVLEMFGVLNAQRTVKEMPAGHRGECDKCGVESPRLMGAEYFKKKGRILIAEDVMEGICPRCRDQHKLP